MADIKNNGTGLENFVKELYMDLGYQDVIRDYLIKKKKDGDSVRGQVDLTYKHFFIRRYVECKQRTDSNVTFDDYAKFETTLKTFNIPTYLGEMVTNTYFDNKVKFRAKETGIKLIDIDELSRLNNLRNNGFYLSIAIVRFIELFETKGFMSALDYIKNRYLPLEQQIQKYTE